MRPILHISAMPLLALGWIFLAPATPAQAFMDCIECHADPNGGGFHGGFRVMSVLSRVEIDAICMSCHDGSYTNASGVQAPEAAVHEQPVGGRNLEYGSFRAGCMDCHNPHGLLAGDGAPTENLQLLGVEVLEASSTDGVARIRKPVIDDGGTPADTSDDTHIGWECDSGIKDDPACDTSEDGFGGTHVRAQAFYGDIYEGGTWPSNGGVNMWANDAPPYNGACNSCHTRTSHHRRDNSGGDHTHNITKAGCVACHSHVSGWLNKGG